MCTMGVYLGMNAGHLLATGGLLLLAVAVADQMLQHRSG